jgi:hypothetical protein
VSFVGPEEPIDNNAVIDPNATAFKKANVGGNTDGHDHEVAWQLCPGLRDDARYMFITSKGCDPFTQEELNAPL